jgi:hypothetical protein
VEVRAISRRASILVLVMDAIEGPLACNRKRGSKTKGNASTVGGPASPQAGTTGDSIWRCQLH